ncbi:hypothetical protein F1847_00580 [Thermodesulfobacterium sp. TA1]|uniref:hypothetical protein n=1 Tax=Thermodesulfobacterium sp. TA1 TaxID=2234087 RepID=UPI0012326EA9|nr:hypothetical protein [Thermodesulfobacterium sp. TA1]QER41303.1 hypothetical protein F1847_00580 [Thermodesulfobacterium sp. TA1]
MVKELIIHIGLYKTGTTSIQEFLYKNKDKLFNEFGIYYPNTYGLKSHNLCAHILRNYYPEHLVNIVNKTGLTKDILLKQFRDELDNVKPNTVLISSEVLSGFTNLINEIVQVVSPKILKLIVYLRRQDKKLESLYSEQVRNLDSKAFPLSPFHIGSFSLDYHKYLKKLEHILGLNKVELKLIPRIYSRDFDRSWDAVKDFCKVLDIPELIILESDIKENISLSPVSIIALKRIKEKYSLPMNLFSKIVSYLYKYDNEKPSKLRSLFSLEERKKENIKFL